MIEPVKSIQGGDSANVFRITMENHWGTHVDAPYHFFDDGRKITDYPPEFWVFKSPDTIRFIARIHDNKSIFKGIECIKIMDLTDLGRIINENADTGQTAVRFSTNSVIKTRSCY